MGFSTTATHVVWFVAIAAVASSVSHDYWATAASVDDAREARERLQSDRLSTRVGDAVWCYNAQLERFNATAVNHGAPINASQVTILADGLPVAGMTPRVWGASGTDVWSRGENASWNKTGVTPEPTRVVVVNNLGETRVATQTECREIASIVITPATRTMQVGDTFDFSAQAFDTANNALTGYNLTFSTTTGTVSNLNDTIGRVVTGTTPGTYYVNATYDAVVASAIITLMPGPPTSIDISPANADVAAGGTQEFTSTLRDSYNNVNTTATPSWSTNAGSVSVGGLLTAQTLAANGKTVTASYAALSAIAAVNVVPGALDHITVTPSSANVLTNSVSVYSAQGYDAYNNAISGLTYSWGATSGSITSAGVFTAPASVGSVTITATVGSVSGTSAITVKRDVHVAAIATYNAGVAASTFARGDIVETRVTIRDHNNTLVAGANVTILLTDPNSNTWPNPGPLYANTDAAGVASLSYTLPANAKKGTWTDAVTAVSGTNLNYDSASNVVTSITFTVN